MAFHVIIWWPRIKCLLTKHSLFRVDASLRLFPHVHFIDGARLADLSGVLLHYKFSSNAINDARQSGVAFVVIGGNYDRMIDVLTADPDFRIKSDTALEFVDTVDLLEKGFLLASENYRSYVRAAGAR